MRELQEAGANIIKILTCVDEGLKQTKDYIKKPGQVPCLWSHLRCEQRDNNKIIIVQRQKGQQRPTRLKKPPKEIKG